MLPVRAVVGYHNDLDKPEAEVAISLTIRHLGSAEEYRLGPVNRVLGNGAMKAESETFQDLTPGTWEVIFQVDYEGDTNLNNNRMVKQVQVIAPPKAETQEKGGAVTD